MSQSAPRLRAAWESLFSEQRLAVGAAAGLILSMLLPWYQQDGTVTTTNAATSQLTDSFNAFQSWGFVEASILLVAIGVIVLCAARADRRAFHLPGGDGIVLMIAGGWVMFLIFYRQLDRPSGNDSGVLRPIGSPAWGSVGVDWGIFVAFLLGALIAYAGWRMHSQHRPEPLLDGDDPHTLPVEGDPRSVASTVPVGSPPAQPKQPLEGQLSFEDAADQNPND